MDRDDQPQRDTRHAGLIETLELLAAQARAYERALPADNHVARAAVAILAELGRQALEEARDIAAEGSGAPDVDMPLTPRELEVLTHAAGGLTNRQIAHRLGLSERTVQYHLRSIFEKTGASSRTEAATLALRQGWLPARNEG